MTKPLKIKDATYLKCMGLDSFGTGSDTCEIDVKDGRVVRTRPFHYDYKNAYDPAQKNPWKIEARGHTFEPRNYTLLGPFSIAYKQRTYSPNRIPYPMKRVDWDPNGERNPQNRGLSKFVRISWDEAAELIAKEVKRMVDVYGSTAILAQADGHGETKAIHGPHGCQTRLLDLLGGCTLQIRTPDSWEGWCWGSKHIWGQWPVGMMAQSNTLKDYYESTELCLYWGADPETTPFGWGGQAHSQICYHLDKVGVRNLFISPDLNYTGACHEGKWIPVLPNTDAALQCAIAYVWMTEGLYDEEYIETHTVGFDWFEHYILGVSDATPKNPKWAEERCGVPSRIIKAFARDWASHATMIMHCMGGGYIRGAYSHEPARLEVTLLAMQAIGKPGTGQMMNIDWQLFHLHHTNAGPRSSVVPSVEGCYHGLTLGAPPPQFIPKTMIPEAILGGYDHDNPMRWHSTTYCHYPASDQFDPYQYPTPGNSKVHMIWTDTPCWTTCWNNGNWMIEALRTPEIETVVAQHPWFENDCLFADIVLPSNTKLEEEDFMVDHFSTQYNLVVHERRCVEPFGESKSDWECVLEVAKKLGLYEELTKGKTIDDCIKDGWEGCGCADMLSYEKFRENEYFIVPTAEGWEDDEPELHAFWRDPEANPIDTPSGKIEIYSTPLAEHFPDDDERGPFPKFVPFGESHQESRLHARSKEYPFLMMSNHPRWRMHANLDDVAWFREIDGCKVYIEGYGYEPVWINPITAKTLGLEHGELIEVYNDRGSVLGAVWYSERVMPDVVYQDHGCRNDPLEPGKLDRGGANNLICPSMRSSKNAPGEVTNSYLVNVRKADLSAMKKKYPDAFARKFDPETGFLLDDWIVKEGE